MDSWSPTQLKLMEHGGNEKMNRFLEKHGVSKTVPAQQKYNTPQAAAYRDKLKCEAEGREWKKPKSMKSGGSSHSKSTSVGGAGREDAGASIAEKARKEKTKGPKMKKGQFDLATGAGSLITTAYTPDADDGWRPPSPKPPKGAREGQFLMGLTPDAWVAFLKSLERQDDRTYHLKKMSADERAQVVAAMSGAPPPPVPKAGKFGAIKPGGAGAGGLGSVNPFGDAPAGFGFGNGGSFGKAGKAGGSGGDSDDESGASVRRKKKKCWDDSSSEDESDDDDLSKRAGLGNIAAKRAERERREREAVERAAVEKAERKARKAKKASAAARTSTAAVADAGDVGNYSMEALKRSAAGKEDFFARKQAENAARRSDLPPSQGGKYSGFGSGTGSVSRPPEVGGFGGIGMNGAPQTQHVPPGVRGGGATAFGNPSTFGGGGAGAWKSQMDDFMSKTKSSSDDMLSKAKGWLSGTLKTWASKLDGGSKPDPAPAAGFHAYQVDNTGNMYAQQPHKRWNPAQSGSFNGVPAGGGGGEGDFYDDDSNDDNGAGSGSRSDSDTDEEYPLAKGGGKGGDGGGAFVPGMANGHAQGRSSDRADVFANSIKGLAADFGGQANLEENFYDDD